MSVAFYRESPGKFDSRTLNRKTLNRWTGRTRARARARAHARLTSRVTRCKARQGAVRLRDVTWRGRCRMIQRAAIRWDNYGMTNDVYPTHPHAHSCTHAFKHSCSQSCIHDHCCLCIHHTRTLSHSFARSQVLVALRSAAEFKSDHDKSCSCAWTHSTLCLHARVCLFT